MRYRITAWEQSGTLERRVFEGESRCIYLDIVWNDAVFYADEEPSISEGKITDIGFLLNDLRGFDTYDYSDGSASLNFEDHKFSAEEKRTISEKWEAEGDDGLTDLGYCESDSLFYITGEIQCQVVADDYEEE